MTVATPTLLDANTQDSGTYKGAIDGNSKVSERINWMFAPHEQSTPDMTVRLEAGWLWDGAALTEVAAQSTGTITAPSTDPRIDRVVVDAGTGAVEVVTGTEAASPSAPAIPSGKLPIAQVSLATSTTAITNDLLTDERAAARNTERSARVELGGDFDPGEEIVCVRQGNVVTITGAGTLSHTSDSVVFSGTNIPAVFRPTDDVDFPGFINGNLVTSLEVTPTGGIVARYYDLADGSAYTNANLLPFSISYVITGNVP